MIQCIGQLDTMANMNKYTVDQIDELIEYLGYCVKEGTIGSGEAIDIVKDKEWDKIEEMRAKGDYYANDYDK